MTPMHTTQGSDSPNVWYFAYGSNMSAAKFIGSRAIIPLDVARVWLPGWILTMEIPGSPYSEPAFSSIRPAIGALELGLPSVTGVAYLITCEQHKKVIASEGGGIAYNDILVDARPVTDKDAARTGYRLKARTLGSALKRLPPGCPSQRYMKIINTGAVEARLPAEYQQFLEELPTYRLPKQVWQRIGAAIFTAFWGPVMALMEKIVHATFQEDGNAPLVIVALVRTTIVVMWFTHDAMYAPIFGRGDGLATMELGDTTPNYFLCDRDMT